MALRGPEDARLEVSAFDQGQGQVARRLLQARGPERIARAQAGDLPDLARIEHTAARDPHLGQERGGQGTEHEVDARRPAAGLDHHVLVVSGGVKELHRAAHGGRAQRLPGMHLHVLLEAADLFGPGLDLHRGHGLSLPGRRLGRGRREGGEEREEGGGGHQRDWRRRRSKP